MLDALKDYKNREKKLNCKVKTRKAKICGMKNAPPGYEKLLEKIAFIKESHKKKVDPWKNLLA